MTDSLKEQRRKKALNKLMRKNQGNCSICKLEYPTDRVVYTCVGYDNKGRFQTTSGCCKSDLVEITSLGLCGYIGKQDVDEAMQRHPLYKDFYGEEKLRDIVEEEEETHL